jgi:hypothetical protein
VVFEPIGRRVVMFYWLEVYTLIAIFVLVPTGLVVLALMACNKIKEYADARHGMQRISAGRRVGFDSRNGLA